MFVTGLGEVKGLEPDTKICADFGGIAKAGEIDDQVLSLIVPDLLNGGSVVAGSVPGSDNKNLRAELRRLNPHLVR